MRKVSTALAAVFIMVPLSPLWAQSVDTPGVDNGTTLGAVTRSAIAGGFDQGAHASDPSGDGIGRYGGDRPRAGLANAVTDHDLSETIDLIDGD